MGVGPPTSLIPSKGVCRDCAMSTHDFVYQTFILYIFVKALILAPLGWMAFMYWWSQRNNSATTEE
jgi:hypothetical protein